MLRLDEELHDSILRRCKVVENRLTWLRVPNWRKLSAISGKVVRNRPNRKLSGLSGRKSHRILLREVQVRFVWGKTFVL